VLVVWSGQFSGRSSSVMASGAAGHDIHVDEFGTFPIVKLGSGMAIGAIVRRWDVLTCDRQFALGRKTIAIVT
jgi:hypothetical protein